jgi:pyruvate dehydrogenase E1 component alpha subunit/2-oxoisovalerate dehydrogenase E1 component alpha subunit
MSLEDLRDDDPDIALFRVLREDGTADPATDPHLLPEVLLRAYREMRRCRQLDARMLSLQRQGRVGFYGGARGQEAVAVAAGLAADPDDWVFPALREQGIMLVRGFPMVTFIAQIFGHSGDLLKGRQMPCHQSARSVGHVSWSSCVGSQAPHAVGAAWAMRARNSKSVALAFLGDGATSQGDFHAAMTFAGVWRVPCVLVCQNNQWSISVPAARQTASRTIAVKARAYGIAGVRADGNDFLAVYSALRSGLERARRGEGPTFIEAVTYRMGPHSTSDDPTRYRSADEEKSWAAKDPIDRLRRHLHHLGRISDAADSEIDRAISAELAAAIEEAEALPGPSLASLFDDVYADMPWHLREQLAVTKTDPGGPRSGRPS